MYYLFRKYIFFNHVIISRLFQHIFQTRKRTEGGDLFLMAFVKRVNSLSIVINRNVMVADRNGRNRLLPLLPLIIIFIEDEPECPSETKAAYRVLNFPSGTRYVIARRKRKTLTHDSSWRVRTLKNKWREKENRITWRNTPLVNRTSIADFSKVFKSIFIFILNINVIWCGEIYIESLIFLRLANFFTSILYYPFENHVM